MKADIHPNYVATTVSCACGHSFITRSTSPKMHLEICSKCHPFFTGQQKFVDTMGRVQRFQTKFGGQYFQDPSKKKQGSIKTRT